MSFLGNLVRSKGFKYALGLAAAALAAYAGTGCAFLAPANSPRAELFDCRQAALEPLLGEILDTKEFLRALYAGQASLEAALGAAGATRAEVDTLLAALNACDEPVSVPDSGLDPS